MLKFGFAALFALALVAGCKDMNHDMKSDKMMSTENVDVCSHCAGMQHLTADGKCSGCGAAVADVCPKCPGVQVKMPDGTCSGCHGKI